MLGLYGNFVAGLLLFSRCRAGCSASSGLESRQNTQGAGLLRRAVAQGCSQDSWPIAPP